MLLPAILASAFFPDAWPVRGEANDLPTVVIDLEIGGNCRLIPASCSGLPTATSVWFAGDDSMTIAQDLTLSATDSADASVPAEALVLPTTPPPRSA